MVQDTKDLRKIQLIQKGMIEFAPNRTLIETATIVKAPDNIPTEKQAEIAGQTVSMAAVPDGIPIENQPEMPRQTAIPAIILPEKPVPSCSPGNTLINTAG